MQWIPKDSTETVTELCHSIEQAKDGLICIALSQVIERLSPVQIDQWASGADIVHSGLQFGSGCSFESVQLCAFNWHFLNPLPDRQAVSWKATRDFVLFDKRLIHEIGPLDHKYSDPDAALMDWVYRALLAGAKTINVPLPGIPKASEPERVISLADQMRFVKKHFDKKAQYFYRICQLLLTGRWLTGPASVGIEKQRHVLISSKLISANSRVRIESYAALIPTIDRYAFVGKSIESLLILPFPPREIVVVDQTPIAKRRPEIYEPYLKLGILKLIYLEQAGQSTARNKGLAAITQPWVLFFEDDSEAWSDMVTEHIDLIQRSGCDVSTGIIVPPGADRSFVPVQNRHYFLADIFTTGNAFMRLDTALSVGGLDPAFDRGPGADDDFGKRLYQSGKVIIYNHRSIETHYKAPTGGMRIHGAWWRNKSTLFGAYPPATQLYTIRKYYSRHYLPYLVFGLILKARKRHSPGAYLLFLLLLPLKLFRSIREANRLRTI